MVPTPWRQFNFADAARAYTHTSSRAHTRVYIGVAVRRWRWRWRRRRRRPSCVTSAGRFRGRDAPIARPSYGRNIYGTYAPRPSRLSHTLRAGPLVWLRDRPSRRRQCVREFCTPFGAHESSPENRHFLRAHITTIIICVSTHAQPPPPWRRVPMYVYVNNNIILCRYVYDADGTSDEKHCS